VPVAGERNCESDGPIGLGISYWRQPYCVWEGVELNH